MIWFALFCTTLAILTVVLYRKHALRRVPVPDELSTSSLSPILLLSAVELAKRIREKQLTSRQIVDACIAQIERVNPLLNAVVRDRFREARLEADEADRLLRKTVDLEDLPPFHGVPCSIKESFAVEHLNCTTGGMISRKDFVAAKDATTVARLRRAGFIPLGVTNTSELTMWMESSNKLYGRTNNPCNPLRTPGGSSGGEAAIVAACGVPVGLGSDIGGSIRLPAFFCGVFGHKPSAGLVPATGHFPVHHNAAARMNTCGPICRRAEDLMPLLRLLAGPDGDDPSCDVLPLGDPADVRLERLRFFSVEYNGIVGVSAELLAAQRKVVTQLESVGCTVTALRLPRLRHTLDIWHAMMALAEPPFATLLFDATGRRPLPELFRWLLGRSEHTLPAIGYAVLDRLWKLFPARCRRFERVGRELREELSSILGQDGVLLCPTYATTAPPHGWPLLPPVQHCYTAAFNAVEFPVTQVPLGHGSDGLPLGIQIAAAHGNDHVTIAVALQLEKYFGGWRPT